MESAKNKAKQVIDDIVNGKQKTYEIRSCQKVGNLNPMLKLVYDSGFAEYVKNLNGKKTEFLREFAKLHKSAVKYGYRGFSPGKKNGIVNINGSNTKMLKDLDKMISEGAIDSHDIREIQPVKVVAHVPSGNRLIGVLDKCERNGYHKVVILGMSHYDKR